jgi:hypothetical protein
MTNIKKTNEIVLQIDSLIKDKIDFSGDEHFYEKIDKIASCYNKSIDKCDESNLCVFTDDNICSLILPKLNLLTKKQNRNIYMLRVADELIRYSRIQQYMFNPNSYLSFSKINYNLNENELLIIHSLITQEFFENLNAYPKNKYINNDNFFNATPNKTQKYNNQQDYDLIMNKTEDININDCIETQTTIKNSMLKKYFKDDYNQIDYKNSKNCTFKLVNDILNTSKTIVEIKQELLEQYKLYFEHSDKIIDILIIEGKEKSGKMILKNNLSFENYLLSDEYYLTVFDLWLLVEKYNLNVIFLSSSSSNTKMHYTQLKENKFVANGSRENKFFHIIVPIFIKNKVPSYSIITDDKNSKEFILNANMYHLFEPNNKLSIATYLEKYTKPIKKKIRKLAIT